MKSGVSSKVKGMAAKANGMARDPHNHKASVASAPKKAAKSPSENYPGKAKSPSMPCKIKGLQT